MKRRALGASGLEASMVAFGAWAIGGGSWWGATDDNQSVRAIHAALDAGVNLIDTAPVYGFGRSEEVVGRAIRGTRDRVLVATKCGLRWQDDRGVPFFRLDGNTVRRCLRPDAIREEVEGSLRRLGTDRIDLLQTHYQAVAPDTTPIPDTMGCLMDLKARGLIRAIGVSNASPAQIEEYRRIGPVDTCQARYSMLDRDAEEDLAPYCGRTGIALIAYSPLEYGLLTGRIGTERRFSRGDVRTASEWFRPRNRRRVLAVLRGWADLTQRYSCTLAQLVVAWTVSQPGVTIAICGARNPSHAAENASAGDIVLDQEDMARMRHDVGALGPLSVGLPQRLATIGARLAKRVLGVDPRL